MVTEGDKAFFLMVAERTEVLSHRDGASENQRAIGRLLSSACFTIGVLYVSKLWFVTLAKVRNRFN